MSTPSSGNHSTSVSSHTQDLAEYIARTVAHLRQQPDAFQRDAGGLLFLGTWNDSIPRRLIRDPVLKPVEVRLWAVMRTLVGADGPAVMPDYTTLAQYTNVASRSTISSAMLVLRIARWLSLCARVRDAAGRHVGNIYALHDEPIPLADAMHLDTGHIGFLHTLTRHAQPRIRRLAQDTLADIETSVLQGEDITQPEDLKTTAWRRLKFLEASAQFSLDTLRGICSPPHNPHPLSEAGEGDTAATSRVQKLDSVPDSRVQKLYSAGKNEVFQEKQQDNIRVQKLYSAPCSSSSKKNKTTTTKNPPRLNEEDTGQCEPARLTWPAQLSADERLLVAPACRRLAQAQAQDVLDELQGRLQSPHGDPIKNPVGWLIASCKRAREGRFQLTSAGLRVRQARQERAERVTQGQPMQSPDPLPAGDPDHPLVQRIQAMRARKKSKTS
ncbi:STY4528 family pathogenicity island replication protein [Ectothiorhodospira haloalkaliphila]|uniref:STY4528 family pathogenicity island replication protein n=1 Tax=Ectothiorhodospira haloalkaliphila TaxID=421628 RepID=UPI001EE823BC|nr:STY4528 family pathogenicity island replication protein [Ectothiorhodospira haloalkaliphila]MCG5526397.1 STY4528 family pathogenicity island replication protein [Ectothiorhodospira haloalkaliphila]